jgi:hypothetical protein
MKNKNVFVTLVLLLMVCIGNAQTISYGNVSADQLIKHAKFYENKYVETVGRISYVSEDGTEMEMNSPNGSIIKIIAGEGLKAFQKDDFNEQKVIVKGQVKLTYLRKVKIEKESQNRPHTRNSDNNASEDQSCDERKKAEEKKLESSQKQKEDEKKKSAQFKDDDKIVSVNIVAYEVKKDD